MPFTPFHMGPGLLLKACLHGSFSLMVFGWAQIVMDIQPLVVLITGEGHLHGFSHTYLGATLLAVVAAISGKYLGAWGLRLIGRTEYLPIGWPVAVTSAFIGTYSHVALDSIMHADMAPLAPFGTHNALLGLISIEALHWVCVGSAVVGGAAWLLLARRLPAKGGRKQN